MNRIETILNNVRIPLQDRAKQRWSDEDLLHFLSKAQQDITKECPILKDWLIVPLQMGQALYTLPEDTTEVIECRFDGRPLHMRTHAEMDNLAVTGKLLIRSQTISANTWESRVAEDKPEAIIYDKLRRRQVRIWPTIVGDALTVSETDLETEFGLVTGIDEFAITGGDYGFPGTIMDTDEGIPLYDTSSNYGGVYGIVSEILDQTSILVHRAKLAQVLETTLDELQVDIICDDALEHFIIARAFGNDQIEKNRQTAAEHLTWYNREVVKLKDSAAINYTTNENRETRYNGMGG